MLQTEVLLYEPDIIAITESWAHEGIPNSELFLDGYNLPFRRDRTDKKGGGILIYMRSNIVAVLSDKIDPDNLTESLWCDIDTRDGNKLLLGVCYDSPANSVEQSDCLYKIIDRAAQKKLCYFGRF